MNPVQKQQLRISLNRYYNIHGKDFVNIDELKRANEYKTTQLK